MELPTPEEVAIFIESEWRPAHDVTVEDVRLDSEGNINAWTTWLVALPDGSGDDEIRQNIKLRQTSDGRLKII